MSTDDVTRLVSILQTIRQIGYDPKKIVAEFSNIKSLRQREKELKNNCRMLENRAAKYNHILPISEQIISFGIGFEELLAFHAAVTEKAGMYNLPMETAGYRVIEDLRDYNKLGGMKKELSKTGMQVYAMNQFSARQNKTITTVFKLLSHGITEDEILDRCNFLDVNKVVH